MRRRAARASLPARPRAGATPRAGAQPKLPAAETGDWGWGGLLIFSDPAVLPPAGPRRRLWAAAPLRHRRDRRPRRDGRRRTWRRGLPITRLTPELIGVFALRARHPGDRPVLDLAGRLDRHLHRSLHPGRADLPADGEHGHLAEAHRADLLGHRPRLRLHRRARHRRLRARRQPGRGTPRAAARSAGSSRTRTTSRSTWWRSCRSRMFLMMRPLSAC